MSVMNSKRLPRRWIHGVLLAVPLALLTPLLAGLETPLPDGSYRAVRGYRAASEACPGRAEIEAVTITAGSISFASGDTSWLGTIDRRTGVIRIETAGITPRPSSPLHIRGHYTKAQLFSAVCGVGYFRILR